MTAQEQHDLAFAKKSKDSPRSDLKKVDTALKKDSITISGLGQELNPISQNKSASLNDNTRLMLSTIGNDLSSISLQMEGVNMTSASGSSTSTK